MTLAPVIHILPLATVVRERNLPVPGQVVVHLDQKVSPTDVVAETKFSQQHDLVDVARQLDLASDEADVLIRCREGDAVSDGQVIARGSGLIPRLVKVPRAGKVLKIANGSVLIEINSPLFKVLAGLPGTITRVVSDLGVVITAYGSLIQGVWGNNRVDMGLLLPSPQMNSSGDILEAKHLDMSLRGAILLAGYINDVRSLQAAVDLPLRGLILGSLSSDLLSLALQAPFPIVLTEGFGHHPMNPVAYKLISTNVNRNISLNGSPFNRFNGTRPEVFIPLPVSQPPPQGNDSDELSGGKQVRIRRNPNMFEVGILTSLLPGLTQFPSGLRLPAAEVQLESGQKVKIPLANLEILG